MLRVRCAAALPSFSQSEICVIYDILQLSPFRFVNLLKYLYLSVAVLRCCRLCNETESRAVPGVASASMIRPCSCSLRLQLALLQGSFFSLSRLSRLRHNGVYYNPRRMQRSVCNNI